MQPSPNRIMIADKDEGETILLKFEEHSVG